MQVKPKLTTVIQRVIVFSPLLSSTAVVAVIAVGARSSGGQCLMRGRQRSGSLVELLLHLPQMLLELRAARVAGLGMVEAGLVLVAVPLPRRQTRSLRLLVEVNRP